MSFVSVVIPVRNGASTVGAQLEALARAEPLESRFEVLVVDNGSTDDTVTVAQSFAPHLPIRVVDASDAEGPGDVRNVGVEAAKGDWLLCCDADDEVDTRWLVEMERLLAQGHQIIGGPIDYTRLNSSDVCAWRGSARAGVDVVLGFLPFAHSSNLAVTRSLFQQLGGFDPTVRPACEDIDFSWRAQLAGYELVEAPRAVVHYRLRSSIPSLWRQTVNYGRSEALLYCRHRDHGLRRRPICALAGDVWWLSSRLPFAWPLDRRGAWVRKAGQFVGRLRGAVEQRVVWW